MKNWIILGIFLALSLSGCAVQSGGSDPPPVIETGADPEAWALVPSGAFLSGQHAHETIIDYDFEIMLTDVTTAHYAEYLNIALDAGVIRLEGGEITGYYPGDEFHGYKHEEEVLPGDKIHNPLEGEKQREPR